MMELQNLQEALKVEIQIHQKLVTQMKQDPQNADLKLQLHNLQAKITALSERQKKVVEQLRRDLLVKQEDMKLQTQTIQAEGQTSTLLITQTQTPLAAGNLNTPQSPVAPIIASKTLPLVLRAATPSSPVIMTPAPTITVVTTLSNTLLASPASSDPQNSPINFQPVIQATNQGAETMRVMPNSTVVVQAASQPIKVPQFVPPTRQTARPATLPQVKPKPPVSGSPAAGQMSLQTLQSPVLLSTALPSSGHVQQMRILNGLPCPNSSNSTGILISAPTHTQPSAQTHTQQIPQNSPSSEITTPLVDSGTEPKTSSLISVDAPTHTSPPVYSDTSSTPSPTKTHTISSKHQDNPLKLAFMLSLGLVTQDYLEEIQSRRQERKRRTTANPIYSGAMFEPERKKSSVSYLTSIHQSSRKRGHPSKNCSIVERGPLPPTTSSHHSPGPQRHTAGSPFTPALSYTLPSHSPSSSPSSAGDGNIHEDFCALCRCSGQLLMCGTCSHVYPLDCLDPPFTSVLKGMRTCSKCLNQILQKEDAIEWPGSLAIVHSYISYKAAKEGEKDRLKRWSTELRQERETLEQRVGQLSNSITRCMESKSSVLTQQREMEASLDKIRGLVRLIRGIQLSPFTYQEFTSAVAMTNGDMSHNGASKPSSSSEVPTDTNNNTNNTTSSSEATVIISTLTNISDTLNQIATNNNTLKTNTANTKSNTSSEGTEEGTQIKNTARIRSEPTNTNTTGFSNNGSNQGVPSSNGTASVGEENVKKHKNNNSDLSVIPQPLLGPIVPLTGVTEGVK